MERVIECARKIGEVDTSPSQFKLSKEEIERGVIFGMTSPVRHSLQPRPISSPDPSPYAPKWVFPPSYSFILIFLFKFQFVLLKKQI